MTKGELGEVLRRHGMWLREEEGGLRASLEGADLRGAAIKNHPKAPRPSTAGVGAIQR